LKEFYLLKAMKSEVLSQKELRKNEIKTLTHKLPWCLSRVLCLKIAGNPLIKPPTAALAKKSEVK
jgi:hypothetical protein